MWGSVRVLALIGAMIFTAVGPASAQTSGGILKLYHRDSPGSLSIHEEATISAVAPAMGLFNNLVLFKPARKTEPAGVHPAGARRQLVVERGPHAAQLQAAPGRQMA
jgi:hypothetical protein